MEINHKSQEVSLYYNVLVYVVLKDILQVVKKSQAGGGVAVKIEHAVYQSAKMFGRHFDDKDEIVSHITRASIDVLKVCWYNQFIRYCMLTCVYIGNIQGRCDDRGMVADQGIKACMCCHFLELFYANHINVTEVGYTIM